MLTIEIEKDELKRMIIKYYESCDIVVTGVRFDVNEYCFGDVNTSIIVGTPININGEKINTTTIIDSELLQEIVSSSLPHVDVEKVEMDYINDSYRNECFKKFGGIKVIAKMKKKIFKKECDINGN